MSDDDTDPMQLLSTTLFEKEWGTALPPSVLDIFDAILSNGSHVRPAIDAHLRRSSAYPEGLDSSPWDEQKAWPSHWTSGLDERHAHESSFGVKQTEPAQLQVGPRALEQYLAAKSLPGTHTLGSLLDLLVACDVVTIDTRGEYSLNPLAPHAIEALPLVTR